MLTNIINHFEGQRPVFEELRKNPGLFWLNNVYWKTIPTPSTRNLEKDNPVPTYFQVDERHQGRVATNKMIEKKVEGFYYLFVGLMVVIVLLWAMSLWLFAPHPPKSPIPAIIVFIIMAGLFTYNILSSRSRTTTIAKTRDHLTRGLELALEKDWKDREFYSELTDLVWFVTGHPVEENDLARRLSYFVGNGSEVNECSRVPEHIRKIGQKNIHDSALKVLFEEHRDATKIRLAALKEKVKYHFILLQKFNIIPCDKTLDQLYADAGRELARNQAEAKATAGTAGPGISDSQNY